ncbi:MAG: NCS2 family permease [Parachlamydia sp.]|nr:NCS2 family permease [Parachlamydia sp.]
MPPQPNTSIWREILAGFTTFATMAYILIVNPQILSHAGMDFGAVMAATAISGFIATLSMGLLARYPFALAPGMGLNAYFAYGIVLGAGHSWQTALGACFLSGLIFLILTVLRIREKIMHAIPASLRYATTAGLGLFLAFIGLKSIGIVTAHPTTLVTLGKITSLEALLAGFGVILIGALMTLEIKGAMLIGILVNWGLGLMLGLVEWKGIVSAPPSLSPTLLKLDIAGALKPEFFSIILSLVFVSLFDVAGTLLGLAEQGKFLTERGRLPRANRALVNDAVGTMAGAVLGTSPLTIHLESAAGISVGGRTGLTAVVVAILLLLSLFLSPLVTSIPSFATAPILIILGGLLMSPISRLNWADPAVSIPAFVIIISIPFTFSIGTGIALGFLLYPLIRLLSGRAKEVHPLIWVLALVFGLQFALT